MPRVMQTPSRPSCLCLPHCCLHPLGFAHLHARRCVSHAGPCRTVRSAVTTPGRSSRHHARQVLLSPSRNEQRNNNAVVTILLLYLNWPAIYILYLLLKEYGK